VLGRLPGAGAEARERHRRAHQLQEGAPLDRIDDRLDLRWKFLVDERLKGWIVSLLLE